MDMNNKLYLITFGGLIFLTITTTTMVIAAQFDDLPTAAEAAAAAAPPPPAAEAATLTKYSDSTHELIGYCAPYHGKVCKSFITSSQVWYSNVSVFFACISWSVVQYILVLM